MSTVGMVLPILIWALYKVLLTGRWYGGNATVTHFKSCSESLSPFCSSSVSCIWGTASPVTVLAALIWERQSLPTVSVLFPRELLIATGVSWPALTAANAHEWLGRVDGIDWRGNHTDATEFHTDALRNKNQIYSQRREGRHNMFPLYPLLKRYIYPRIEDFIWKTEIYSLYKSWYAKKIIVPEGTKVWFVPLVPSLPLKAKPPCSDLHSYSSIRRILESIRDCFRQPGIFFWSQPIYSHFTFSGSS